MFGLNVNVHWIGKHTIFKNGLSKVMKKLGGIPVNRTSPELLINDITDIVKRYKRIIIAISPEGTRKKVTSWRTGFYYIAKQAKVPIIMFTLDFGNKQNKSRQYDR